MGNTITGQNISVTINGNHYSLEAIEGAVSFNYTVDFMAGERIVNGTYDGSKLENTVIKSGLIRINPPVLSIIKTVDVNDIMRAILLYNSHCQQHRQKQGHKCDGQG